MAYTDIAYFSHPRYGVHQASQAWDNVLMTTYKYHHWEFLARYRLKIRGKDNADKTRITDETMQRGRLSLGYTSHGWSLCTQLDVALSDYLKRSFGYMATESVTCNALSWLAFTVTAVISIRMISPHVFMFTSVDHSILSAFLPITVEDYTAVSLLVPTFLVGLC